MASTPAVRLAQNYLLHFRIDGQSFCPLQQGLLVNAAITNQSLVEGGVLLASSHVFRKNEIIHVQTKPDSIFGVWA